MRASRLLSILMTLQLRGRVSAETLAREFEVSVRTIYRDIDQLSAAGVPVYAERGRDGGFALHEGYRTRLTGFTAAEAEALALAGVGGAAADLGVGPEAAAAQLKLLASLPPGVSANARQVAERFHLDPVAWYARAETIDLLPMLAEAVWRERRIRIRYESWKADVRRELDPLGLVLKGGLWYLIAGSNGQPRTYRAANIHELEVLDAKAKRPPRFDLARFWKAWAKAFEARLLTGLARVRLSPDAMRVLRDTHPAAAEAARAKQRPSTPKGWIETDIPVEDVPFATTQLLRLGAGCEVLAPASLRSAIAAEARAVARLHARRR
ncbi:MAG: helix-turn-helix transcriptional regulator [Hyphomonadaceae bacterium]